MDRQLSVRSSYNPQEIESKWQAEWEKAGLYLTSQSSSKEKYYCLDFFPYPSGEGLHVGHCRNYVPTDVLSRYKRMQGFNVLHPMGWDAFGEPAEQYAVAHGVHPRITTTRNTANFRRQMTLIGTSYDWSREIDSSDPLFYRWTQYFFLLLYRRGLAYRDTNWQWWCQTCQTTLSSHEVSGGACWRGHTGVIRREIPAWYFRITAYADELLSGLNEIDWPERIKIMQRNWIGRSRGCEIIFTAPSAEHVPVFTTRPDTVFGATFFVLSPEHPLVEKVATFDRLSQVKEYQDQAARLSEIERMIESREKTGVFTGGYVTNPLNGELLPVWVADYVLLSYGTGAVMGVPAHDQRDFEFARRYNVPVRPVIVPQDKTYSIQDTVFTESGVLINSGPYNGLTSEQAADCIAEYLKANNLGGPAVNYRMRDWLISRQRYWGTPIPIIFCPQHGEQPVPDDQLPVWLPPMQDFQPDGSGRSPLARIPEFTNTTCPVCGGPAQRESDTMGGFACSSWYFLRFTSPHQELAPFDRQDVEYWMPVDLYVGGAEHAVLHLLYARFWTKVMADADLLSFREPFIKLLNQGQLMGPDGLRMAKSRGNVITPDSIVQTYGADSLRVYELFMAPFDQDIAWSTAGINGARRFLNRVWRLYADTYKSSASATTEDPGLLHILHRTIRQVSERIEGFRFNTMISTLMEFLNVLAERQNKAIYHTTTYHHSLDTLLILLAPTAPHLCEELWQLTGHKGSIHQQAWPKWDSNLAREEVQQVAVQVDGRLRQVIEIPSDLSEEEVRLLAFTDSKVQTHLAGRDIEQIYYVSGKILSIVTKTGR